MGVVALGVYFGFGVITPADRRAAGLSVTVRDLDLERWWLVGLTDDPAIARLMVEVGGARRLKMITGRDGWFGIYEWRSL